MKGLRLLFCCLFKILTILSELTWFMKGLRHYKTQSHNQDSTNSPNWPDLWRDCDRLHALVLYVINWGMSELTWFMKGLRHVPGPLDEMPAAEVRIDLIYEGIATFLSFFLLLLLCHVRIDLIYEGIATSALTSCILYSYISRPNWPDLWRDCDVQDQTIPCKYCPASELTWFMKGLRHDF